MAGTFRRESLQLSDLDKLQFQALVRIFQGKAPGEKARVALDIDGVTADVHTIFVDEINRRKGTKYTIDDINHYDTGKSRINIPIKEFLEDYYIHAWLNHWKEIPLMLDVEKLKEVAFETELHCLSNRKEITREPLKMYLDHHRITMFVEPHQIVTQDFGKDKSENNYDVYIDDMPSLATSIGPKKNKFLFLVKRPYTNGVAETENIRIARSTNEALQMIIDAKRAA